MTKLLFPAWLSEKLVFFLVALSTGGLLLFAYVLEFFVDLVPCPLCIVQRFFYLLIGLVALATLFRWVKWLTPLSASVSILCLSLLGGLVALRQVWLQHFSVISDSTRCGVTFGSFLDSVLQALGGLGNCTVVDWTFLSLSIAEWSFLWFLILAIAGLWLVAQVRERRKSREVS